MATAAAASEPDELMLKLLDLGGLLRLSLPTLRYGSALGVLIPAAQDCNWIHAENLAQDAQPAMAALARGWTGRHPLP